MTAGPGPAPAPAPGRRRPRVALVSSGLGPAFGGIGVVSEMIAGALEPLRVEVWRHRHRWPRPLRVAALLARAFAGSLGRPDLVFYEHVDLAKVHAVVPALRALPYGVFLHGVEAWKPLDGRRRAAFLGARVVVTNSANTARLTAASNPWFPGARVAWLGVDGGAAGDPPAGDRGPVALVVGRMASGERYKGHDQILDGWPEVRRAVPEARLVVVGGGDDLPRLRGRAEAEGLAGVEFRGKVGGAELAELYRTSRVFLFPSREEGFGLAAVEAAAAGLPVLGLRGTVMEELFPGGRGVALVDEQTGPRIAGAVIPLLSDPGLAGSLGRAARDRVRATFLREHFASRFREAVAPFL